MRLLSFLLAALILSPAAPAAQGVADDGGAIDAAQCSAIVERLADQVAARYCLPEDAAKIAAHLREELAAGHFQPCTTRASLAYELTDALRAVNGDKHFKVRVRPEGQMAEDEVDPLGAFLRRGEELRESNCGVVRAEVLQGNVGLLDLRAFAPVDAARAPLAAAMNLLAGVDALIVDVSRNPGGDPATVRFLCSYFFGERTHLNSLVYRLPEGGERVDEFWTLDEVPGKRLVDVPLFVVASSFTGSGAEEFTYDLKTQERAMVVGQTTVGAANPGGFLPLDERLEAFVSSGRALNPITKTNWEGVGVAPDVEVAGPEALDRAIELARRSAEEYRTFRREEREAALADAREALKTAAALADAGKADEALAELRDPFSTALRDEVLDESMINLLGYDALEEEHVERALALLRFNAEAFPRSANAHDSLGEAWRRKGDTARALAAYRRALELDPGLRSARRAVDELGGAGG